MDDNELRLFIPAEVSDVQLTKTNLRLTAVRHREISG
jgi:hypothetical protein